MYCTPLARTVGISLALSLCAVKASAAIITFDALTATATRTLPVGYQHQEAGFQLTNGLGDSFMVWGSNNQSYTGSGAMSVVTNNNRGTTLTRIDGGAFSLDSIDLSEWTPDTVDPFEIVFSAYLNGAWVWNFSVFLDGEFGNQTFNFGSVFSKVTEVEFGPRGDHNFQFDNVVLDPQAAAVPEPGSLGLVGVALLGGLVATRRGRAGRVRSENPSR